MEEDLGPLKVRIQPRPVGMASTSKDLDRVGLDGFNLVEEVRVGLGDIAATEEALVNVSYYAGATRRMALRV